MLEFEPKTVMFWAGMILAVLAAVSNSIAAAVVSLVFVYASHNLP